MGAALALVLIAGCGSAVPSGAATVGMVNATSVPIAVHVNGAWIGTYPAWSETDRIVVIGNGGPPWRVEFRTPDAFTAGEIVVPGSGTPAGRSGSSWRSTCGEFVAWWGDRPPDAPSIGPDAVRPPNPPCR